MVRVAVESSLAALQFGFYDAFDVRAELRQKGFADKSWRN